jgi:hypothetical protein
VERLVTHWTLAPSAIAVRIPFDLGPTDERVFRIDRNLRGFIDYLSESVELGPKSVHSRMQLRAVGANLSGRPTGQELFAFMFGRGARSKVSGNAYLVRADDFMLGIQTGEDLVSFDKFSFKGCSEWLVRIVDAEKFASQYLVGASDESGSLNAIHLDIDHVEQSLTRRFSQRLGNELARLNSYDLAREMREEVLDRALIEDIRRSLAQMGIDVLRCERIVADVPEFTARQQASVSRAQFGRDGRDLAADRAAAAEAGKAIVDADELVADTEDYASDKAADREIKRLRRARADFVAKEGIVVDHEEDRASLEQRRRQLETEVHKRVLDESRVRELAHADFVEIVRDCEHKAGLRELFRTGELEDIRRQSQDKLRRDQLLSDIDLRAIMRRHLVSELEHDIAIEDARTDATIRNTAKVRIADLDHAKAGEAFKQDTLDRESARKLQELRAMHEIDKDEKSASAAIEIDRDAADKRFRLELMAMLQSNKVPSEVVAMIIGASVEVQKAAFDTVSKVAEAEARGKAVSGDKEAAVAAQAAYQKAYSEMMATLADVAKAQAAPRTVVKTIRSPDQRNRK